MPLDLSVARCDYRTHNTTAPPHVEPTKYVRYIADRIPMDADKDPTESNTRAHAEDFFVRTVRHRGGPMKALAGERLYNQIRANTGLAETIAEIAGDFNNIARRTDQLIRSYKYLRKGKLGRAARSLGTTKRFSTSSADAYLEWQFAIKPTIDSISDSVEFLQSHPLYHVARSGSRDRVLLEQAGSGTFFTITAEMQCFNGARVRLTNPNLALADSYGFLNPAKLGWELIPGSFLVDYFVPIGNFLGSFSPLYGRSIDRTYTSSVARGIYEYRMQQWYQSTPSHHHLYKCMGFERELGIRNNYSQLDVLRLKLPPKAAADTTVALAVKTFRK